MLTPSTHPILTLVTFGLATLFVGGYLGGEMARRQNTKEEIKALQAEHEKTLARIDSAFQRARAREEATLAQIDSVYAVLEALNAREAETRGNINARRGHLNKLESDAKAPQKAILDAAPDSEITLKKKNDK